MIPLAVPAAPLPQESPFSPPPAAATPVLVDAGYRLAGMTEVGKETLISVIRESDKRNTWIAVGKTEAEITVVSYDPNKEQAVLRVAGKELVLTLPKPSNTPAPQLSLSPATNPLIVQPGITAPASSPTEPPLTLPPLTPQEEKEMEARMLVTDLLEIGQLQRKAYQEAQREAARKAAAAPAPAGAAPKK